MATVFVSLFSSSFQRQIITQNTGQCLPGCRHNQAPCHEPFGSWTVLVLSLIFSCHWKHALTTVLTSWLCSPVWQLQGCNNVSLAVFLLPHVRYLRNSHWNSVVSTTFAPFVVCLCNLSRTWQTLAPLEHRVWAKKHRCSFQDVQRRPMPHEPQCRNHLRLFEQFLACRCRLRRLPVVMH